MSDDIEATGSPLSRLRTISSIRFGLLRFAKTIFSLSFSTGAFCDGIILITVSAGKVSDLSFAEFVHILDYEALLNGCEIVKINRWVPSSKACHCCGAINDKLSLKDRIWDCPSCHAHLDRDINAAINILNQGMLSKYGKAVI